MNPQNQYQPGYQYQMNQQFSQPTIQRGDSRYGNPPVPPLNENSMSQYDRNDRVQAPPSPTHSVSESQRESNITHSAIKQETVQKDQKDVNKLKPSELNTDKLKLNDKKIWAKDTFKILTKIHFGKKQFVFEIQDLATYNQNQQKDAANSSQAQDIPDIDTEYKLKKKLELPFKDIEKLSFIKQRQEITIETTYDKIKQCQEPKKKGNDSKKTTQWIESSFLLQEDNVTPLFGPKEQIIIESVYPKDTLTKSGSGRISHLQKIQLWVDVTNLYIDGERFHRNTGEQASQKDEKLEFKQIDRDKMKQQEIENKNGRKWVDKQIAVPESLSNILVEETKKQNGNE